MHLFPIEEGGGTLFCGEKCFLPTHSPKRATIANLGGFVTDAGLDWRFSFLSLNLPAFSGVAHIWVLFGSAPNVA